MLTDSLVKSYMSNIFNLLFSYLILFADIHTYYQFHAEQVHIAVKQKYKRLRHK